MKPLLLLLLVLTTSLAAWSCPVCRPRVEAGIHNATYPANLGLVLLPAALVLSLGLLVFYWDKLVARFTSAHDPHS